MGPHTWLGGFLGVMRRLVIRSSLLKRMPRMMPPARKVEPYVDYLVVVSRKLG